MVAGAESAVAVDTELEPFGMDVIAERLHSAGEPRRVRLQVAVRVAGFRHPVIVQIQVDVPGVLHSGTHHHIGDSADRDEAFRNIRDNEKLSFTTTADLSTHPINIIKDIKIINDSDGNPKVTKVWFYGEP